MKITFFGHQTWGVESNKKTILFDPLLEPYFGASSQSFCAIYPFREIIPLNNIEAIFLSHEHADHFNIDTLHKLNKNIVVYTGVLMPANVDYGLSKLGFTIKKFNDEEKIYFDNGLTVVPYHAGKDTPYWEKRVYQFEIANNLSSFFLAVDAGIAKSIISKIKNNQMLTPGLFAIANNSQVTSLIRKAAFENEKILPEFNSTKNGLIGLQIYKSLLVDYLDGVIPGHVAICGGGFLKGSEDLTEQPLSQHWEIAEAIANFSNSKNLSAPKPGFTYIIENNILVNTYYNDTVKILTKEQFCKKNLPNYQEKVHNLYYPYCAANINTIENNNFSTTIRDFLSTFAMTEWGRIFFYECIKLNIPTIITFRIDKIEDKSFKLFSFSLGDGSFQEDMSLESTIIIKLYDSDFSALLKGEVESWDLSGSHISIDFPKAMPNYIIPYFYSYFGEQLKQDLAMKFIEKKLLGLNYVI
jgi:hypothetical protein